MKTRLILVSVYISLLTTFLVGSFASHSTLRADLSDMTFSMNVKQDTAFLEYSGVVYDKLTKNAISFASILINETNIGTVANSEGEFLIKIPQIYETADLQISSLGYKTLLIPLESLQSAENEFFLEPTSYFLEEVEIRKLDPINLIRDALRNVLVNYGSEPSMLTAFYRETIRQNRNYVAVSEAVFDVYKSGYGKVFDNDRIRIFKGRKSQDVSRMDTVVFKLQGGPYYIFQLDIARHPGDILSGDILDYYDYEVRGLVTLDDRNAYAVAFEQKRTVDLPLYKGVIFIDVVSKAIAAVEFSLSDINIRKAADYMIVKKPATMKVDVVYADYRVNYRYTGNKWVLNYARSEAHFRCRWDRRLFRSNYFVMSEAAITDVDTSNIVKHRLRDTSRPAEILVERVSDFEDPEFWGDYNIIRPEQTIEQAIEKLGRRLRRLGTD